MTRWWRPSNPGNGLLRFGKGAAGGGQWPRRLRDALHRGSGVHVGVGAVCLVTGVVLQSAPRWT
jgi:hypothetical protein